MNATFRVLIKHALRSCWQYHEVDPGRIMYPIYTWIRAWTRCQNFKARKYIHIQLLCSHYYWTISWDCDVPCWCDAQQTCRTRKFESRLSGGGLWADWRREGAGITSRHAGLWQLCMQRSKVSDELHRVFHQWHVWSLDQYVDLMSHRFSNISLCRRPILLSFNWLQVLVVVT